jgi:hypothetical protein
MMATGSWANAFMSSAAKHLSSLKIAMGALTSDSTKYTSRAAAEFSADIIEIIESGPIPTKERQFLINGWRWHTASALRDLQRYAAVLDNVAAACTTAGDDGASSMTDSQYKERITQCYSFVIDYNLKALMKIETELFFPWLRRLLPPTADPLMSELTQEQNDVRTLSTQIGQLCSTLSGSSNSALEDVTVIRKIESKIQAIRKSYKKIQSVQESIFVPYISAFIPKKEQERFNRKVISALGMLQAQVHLVGMIEAIKDQPQEMKLLRAQIPSLVQATMSIWKKRLYDPKTKCLSMPSDGP